MAVKSKSTSGNTAIKRRKTAGPQTRLRKPKKVTKPTRVVAPVEQPAKANPFKETYFRLPEPRFLVAIKDRVRRGRLSVLDTITREQYSQYLEAIRQGCFPTTAMGVFGVPPRRFQKWREKGMLNTAAYEEGEEPLDLYGQLHLDTVEAQSVARTRAECKELYTNSTNFLMNGPGRQTREREGYASGAQRLEVSGPSGGPIEHEVITREDKRAAIAGALSELAKVPGLLQALMQQGAQPAIVVDVAAMNGNGHKPK